MATPDSNDPLQSEIDAALGEFSLQELEPDGTERHRVAGERHLQRGTIVGVSGSEVIVELGPRVQGAIELSEFDAPPEVGQAFEFTLNGQDEDGLWRLSRRAAKALAAWDDLYLGAQVKATVQAANKGGLELKVGPLRAFMPASHIDLVRVEDLESLAGETWVCEVIELEPAKQKIVLSRRNVLKAEREAARGETLERLIPGAEITGKVTRVEPFGCFVDLGGVEGLVHVSNLSRKRVDDPNDLVKQGDEVRVMVLEIKEGGKRIGLGMKQLEPDPWDDVHHRFAVDQVVQGKVVRMMDFGAFVEIEPGLEGLLHVSQMLPNQRVNRPQDVLELGQELPVRLQSIDPAAQRLSLSRLDQRGALLGSEDAADSGKIDEVLEEGQTKQVGTNLGALFKKALESE